MLISINDKRSTKRLEILFVLSLREICVQGVKPQEGFNGEALSRCIMVSVYNKIYNIHYSIVVLL